MKRIILLIIAVLMLAGCAPTTGSPEEADQTSNNTNEEQGALTGQTDKPQDAQPTDDPGNFSPPQDDNLDNPKNISELRAILEKSVGVIRSGEWMTADEAEDAAMEMPAAQSDMSDSVAKMFRAPMYR